MPARLELWRHDVDSSALVLGSSQDDAIVDRDACDRAGIAIVRRRSGGGAVLLVSGEVTWLDVIVPTGSFGWSPDVHRPMVWLGRHLAAAIATLLGADVPLSVHVGAMLATPWSSRICFDGLGAGEVLLDGRKLVGISQRRTREYARLQCCWYSAYDPAALPSLFTSANQPAVSELSAIATLPTAVADAVPAALLDRLG